MRAGEPKFTSYLLFKFPFLFGGTFIEGLGLATSAGLASAFPFLFGGTFIEGRRSRGDPCAGARISLPFRRDFH